MNSYPVKWVFHRKSQLVKIEEDDCYSLSVPSDGTKFVGFRIANTNVFTSLAQCDAHGILYHVAACHPSRFTPNRVDALKADIIHILKNRDKFERIFSGYNVAEFKEVFNKIVDYKIQKRNELIERNERRRLLGRKDSNIVKPSEM